MNLYDSLETGTRRKLQNDDNPDGVVLTGVVDSDGFGEILEGGVARFVTQNKMQVCNVIKVEQKDVFEYHLETSCGSGILTVPSNAVSLRCYSIYSYLT